MDRRHLTNDPSTPAPAASHSHRLAAPRRASTRAPTDGGAGDARREQRADLAAWLTAGRTARGLTRDQVARVTRIQLRTLERLEEGRFDELPADVFVRGFIRSYARCVGLSVDEALARYAGCGFAAAPVASAQAQALIDSMASLAPAAARTSSVTVVPAAPRVLRAATEELVVAAPAPVAPAPSAPAAVAAASARDAGASGSMAAAKSGRQRDARGRFVRKGTPSAQMEAVDVSALGLTDDLEVEITVEETPPELLATPVADVAPAALLTAAPTIEAKLDVRSPVATAPATAVARPVVTVRPAAPALSIDDDDPEAAEREREDRARARDKDGGWRSFLPPALLDQDRGRQGGLTLAVIILLIVATLTLSYLMRRPSSTGEGVTLGESIPTRTV